MYAIRSYYARDFIGLDAFGPGDHQGRARAAEVCSHELGALEWSIPRPSPAVMVHRVEEGTSQRVEAAVVPVQHSDVLLDRRLHAVLGKQLGDRTVHALCRRSIVRVDVEDQRVFADAEVLEFAHDAAVLDIGLFQEARVHLHQTRLERSYNFV